MPSSSGGKVDAQSVSRSAYSEASNTDSAIRATLSSIAALLARQRAAIQARDVAALDGVYSALLPLLADLDLQVNGVGGGRPECGDESARRLQTLAREVREQIALNRTLLRNGMAIADHLMVAARETASSQALFTGVG